MASNKIIVEFDLGKNGGKHAFKSISEIQEWVNQEASSINWFTQTDSNTSNIYSALSQTYGSFRPSHKIRQPSPRYFGNTQLQS